MTFRELKNELNSINGMDDYQVDILLEELPTKLKTTPLTRIGICIEDKIVVLGFGKCPHCIGEE